MLFLAVSITISRCSCNKLSLAHILAYICFLFVYCFISVCLCLSIYLSIYLSIHIHLYFDLLISIYLYLYLSIHICLSVLISLSLSLSLSMYSSIYIYLVISICISVYSYLFQPIWLMLPNTPTASLQKGKNPPNECPRYDARLSDSEAPVQKIWKIWSTLFLPLLPGPLWTRVVVVPVRFPSMDQIELFNH